MPTRFSGRLDWRHTTENALASLERKRRERGEQILDLTESNPTTVDLPDTGQAEAISSALARGALASYRPNPRGLPAARRAIADQYAAAGDAIDAEHLILTTSSSESYSWLWKLLCDPGDTVLVPEPSYPLFDYLARLEGVATVPYRLTHDGTRSGDWRLDLESLDQVLSSSTRRRIGALVLVSPNNPTGSVLGAEDLGSLDRRAADAGFALVADEVFSDYVVEGTPAQAHCIASREMAALTFSLGGLSKSCGLPHLKLGWIAVGGPDGPAQAALDRLELIADTYLSVSTPVQVALPDLLREGASRRRFIAARLAENRLILEQACSSRSPLSVLRSDGGWLAILRLPAVRTDESWALALLEEDGVLVHPGYFFDLRGATYLVVSLLPRPEVFREGIERLATRVNREIA